MQTGERAVLLALGDEGIGHVTPNAAHADESEANAVLDRGELSVRRVDVRRQHRRAVVVATRDVADEAVGVAHVARQHCGHVLVGIMRLQVRRAHDQDGVCSRVRFVERILSELLRVVPNLLRDVERIAILDRTVVPVFLEQAHDVDFLLAHCFAQLVCLAGGKAAHHHGHLHDLFLVDHGAVGFLEHRAQAVVVVVDGRLAARHLHVVVDHAGLERARTVEGDRCDDVGEAARWEPCEQAHVQRAFYLEQAVHVARAHEGERALVVGGNLLGHHLDAGGLLDVATCARKHAQSTQSKEVHFKQAQVRRVMAVILRDDAAAFGVALHGHVVGHRVAADDGCAGMHALTAHMAFD